MPKPYKKIRRPERHRLIAVIAVTFLAFAAWLAFSPHGAMRYYRVSRDLRTAKAENQRITAENKELAKEIHRLKNDRAYQEDMARRTFGMVRKNEIVFDFGSEKKKEKEKE
jgi:cell division protein FtsB